MANNDNGILCFFLTATLMARSYLRRYSNHDAVCKGADGKVHYHEARAFVGVVPHDDGETMALTRDASEDDNHPSWPKKCDHCNYKFTDEDARQVFNERIYQDSNGNEHSIRNPPVGAMWYADWLPDTMKSDDGHALMVMTPGGKWLIDGPASNCTKPQDRGPYPKHHRCWIRHGIPPKVTVDKQGVSCSAGAGSIQCGNYHGFLRNGYLTQ